MTGLFFFDSTQDTIIRTGKGYKITFQGQERPERFPSLHDASTFLSMLQSTPNP